MAASHQQFRSLVAANFDRQLKSPGVPATATAIFASDFDRHEERSKSLIFAKFAGNRLVCALLQKSLAIADDQFVRNERIESPSMPLTLEVGVYVPIMMMAANRSSISLSGFCRARNSARPCPSRFFSTLLVSDTTAAALNTARSCAIWYSGRACKLRGESS